VETVGPNFRGVVGGSPEGTLLHHAAWMGNPSTVRELLALGADPVASGLAEFSTPLGWAALSSGHNHSVPDRDFLAVAQALVDAGAEVEPRFVDVAAGPLLDWLQAELPEEST